MMEYGRTWWGKKWLEAFNNIDFSNRLPRGRNYANRGSVSDIKISGNTIVAKVQGSRRTPYKVTIDIESFSKTTIKKVHEVINNSPAILAKLVNRELSSSLLSRLVDENIKLFPSKWNDLKASCSCPDWAMPCKHIAAVIYLIAAEIDKNPFVIFTLHDCSLEDIIKASKKNTLADIRKIPHFSQQIMAATVDKKNYKGLTQSDFSSIDFSKISYMGDKICALLTKDALFYSKDFREILQVVYKHWKRSPTKLDMPLLSEDVFMARWGKLEQALNATLIIDGTQQCIEVHNEVQSSLTITELVYFFDQMPSSYVPKLSPSLRLLHLIYQYALTLIQHAAIIPQIMTNDDNNYFVRWVPALCDEVVADLYEQICALHQADIVVYKNGVKGEKSTKNVSLAPSTQVFTAISLFASTLIKDNLPGVLSNHASSNIFTLFFSGKMHNFADFSTKEIPQTISLWLERLYVSEKPYVLYLFIDELKNAFSLQIKVELIKKKITQLVDLEEIVSSKKNNDIQLAILADLMLLCEYIPELEALVDNAHQKTLELQYKNFVPFFLDILPLFRFLGIKVILPKSLEKMISPRLALTMSSDKVLDKNIKTFLSLDELLTFDWKVALGDQQINIYEFKIMLQESHGIVKIRDQYVIFDEQRMAAFLKKCENIPNHFSSSELMQAGLAGSFIDFDVQYDDHIAGLFGALSHYQPVAVPQNLRATLRPYQEKGFSWLVQNMEMGFGSILADDMGLGKTVQVISSILYLKNNGLLKKQKALIIAPTSLLSNWQKEIHKFAPDIKAELYHGKDRALSTDEYDVLITSYGLARRDKVALNKLDWLVLIIDEAQNIKNYATEQSKVIKSIRAIHKIAMSGTPVENRLSEYWSIFDFTNKDYLGTIKHFNKNFAIPIEKEHNRACLEIFSKITSPFILRRVKSDKSIISDLPDKIENNRYCNLTAEQAALYEQVTQITLKKIELSEGIARRGLIFQLLNALKQICNHPSQYVKKKHADMQGSGKMQMLADLLSSINALGEKVLIFTQYVEMGDLLVNMIAQHLGVTVPFLHGGLSIKQRDGMVHDFQNVSHVRIMIISLKAGGTGLNLTAANHVIHYDLWWNPAVEAQATDRAYRIGQQKNVMVYRFITSNTFEERINDMIQQKKQLAQLTVASGEQWITELSNDQLKDLISLRKEDIVVDGLV